MSEDQPRYSRQPTELTKPFQLADYLTQEHKDWFSSHEPLEPPPGAVEVVEALMKKGSPFTARDLTIIACAFQVKKDYTLLRQALTVLKENGIAIGLQEAIADTIG